jgi:hypothetical protein
MTDAALVAVESPGQQVPGSGEGRGEVTVRVDVQDHADQGAVIAGRREQQAVARRDGDLVMIRGFVGSGGGCSAVW